MTVERARRELTCRYVSVSDEGEEGGKERHGLAVAMERACERSCSLA